MSNIYGLTWCESDLSDFVDQRFQLEQLEIYFESVDSFNLIKVKLKVFQIRMRLNEVIHHLNE